LEMGSCKLFALGLPQTAILPILAFQLARITDMSAQLYINGSFFSFFFFLVRLEFEISPLLLQSRSENCFEAFTRPRENHVG
jgi:hypothetical protein